MKTITSDDLYKLLEEIKQRPGMYLGTKSLYNLKLFLDGILHGLNMTNEHYNSKFLDGFGEWIACRYEVWGSVHWSSIISLYSTDEADAFDRFYSLLKIYMSIDKKEMEQKLEKLSKLRMEYEEKLEAANIDIGWR